MPVRGYAWGMRRALLVGVCVVVMGCGGFTTVTDEDASVDGAGDDADAVITDDASTSSCRLFLCGTTWKMCDETGHAVCQNRKATCNSVLSRPCDAGAD